jgi:hypothetical protein
MVRGDELIQIEVHEVRAGKFGWLYTRGPLVLEGQQ